MDKREDSNKWSNIGFGEEMYIIEIKICILSGSLGLVNEKMLLWLHGLSCGSAAISLSRNESLTEHFVWLFLLLKTNMGAKRLNFTGTIRPYSSSYRHPHVARATFWQRMKLHLFLLWIKLPFGTLMVMGNKGLGLASPNRIVSIYSDYLC